MGTFALAILVPLDAIILEHYQIGLTLNHGQCPPVKARAVVDNGEDKLTAILFILRFGDGDFLQQKAKLLDHLRKKCSIPPEVLDVLLI